MADFEKAIEAVLKFEGGYSDDPADRGGQTKYGITIYTAKIYGYHGQMKDLPVEKAKEIYKSMYWDKNNLGDIHDQKVAEEVFDTAVNCGPMTSVKFLQEAVNLLSENGKRWDRIVEDGVIGKETLKVINSMTPADLVILAKVLNGMQFIRYITIIRNDPTQARFLRGWVKRT